MLSIAAPHWTFSHDEHYARGPRSKGFGLRRVKYLLLIAFDGVNSVLIAIWTLLAQSPQAALEQLAKSQLSFTTSPERKEMKERGASMIELAKGKR